MSTEVQPLSILISRRFGAGRSIIRGILEGLGNRQRWLIDLQEPWPWSKIPQLIAQKPAGFIVGLLGEAEHRAIADSGIPCVVTGNPAPVPLPAVGTDSQASAHLAVQHFQSLKFSRMAWLGFQADEGTTHLGHAVSNAAKTCGIELFLPPPTALVHGFENGIKPGDDTAKWLQSLPVGTGLFCVSDLCAWQVLQACRLLNISVPDQLAVLGSNNDDLLCTVAEPPLSSIDTDMVGLGRRAGELLVQQIDGIPVPADLVHISPRGLIHRQSSAMVATSDPLVRWAVDWIRAHMDEHLTIKRLVHESGVSRRTLEARFKAVLGRSPLAEIHRQQTELARLLMTIDGLSPADAAAHVGLSSSQQLNRLFQKHLGILPSSLHRH